MIVIGIAIIQLTNPDESLAIIITLITSSFMLIGLSIGFGPLLYKYPIRTLGLVSPPKRISALLLWPIVALFASFCFLALYMPLLSMLNIETPEPVPFNTNLPTIALVIIGLLVILVGPLAEELFFRGFIFPTITKRFGLALGAIGNSLVFALFHIDPVLFLPTFVAGLILTFLYIKTHSLAGSFIAHGAQNCIAFIGAITASDLNPTATLCSHMLY